MANGKKALQRMSARDRAAQRATKAPNGPVRRSYRGMKKGEQEIHDEARLSNEPEVYREDNPYEEKAASDTTREETGSTKSDGELEAPSEGSGEEDGLAGVIQGAFGGWKGRDNSYENPSSDSEEEVEELMIEDSHSELEEPVPKPAAKPTATRGGTGKVVATREKPVGSRQRGRPRKVAAVAGPEIPEVIRIPLMVVIEGSENLVMVDTDASFEEMRDSVAEKLKKYPGTLELRYRPSWNTNKSDRTSVNSNEEWEFLIEKIKAHVMAALQKKANNGAVPPWTISVFNGEDDAVGRPGAKEKPKGKAKDKDNEKPKEVFHGNIEWHEKLQNAHKCVNNKHDYPCFVLETELYAPEIPKGTHLRLTPGILARWARLLQTHEAGLSAPPPDILLDIFKANNFFKEKDAGNSVYGKTGKKGKKMLPDNGQAGYPFPFPMVSLPSFNLFSPFKGPGPVGRDDDDDDVATPQLAGKKRTATKAEIDDDDFDGPLVREWLESLDQFNYAANAFDYASLVPKAETLQIQYLADLLQFNGKELMELMDISAGMSTYLLRKAKVAMKRARQEALTKRVHVQ